MQSAGCGRQAGSPSQVCFLGLQMSEREESFEVLMVHGEELRARPRGCCGCHGSVLSKQATGSSRVPG